MNVSELLSELESRGTRVEVHGDRLRIQPPESVDEALLEAIRAHKGELVELLRPECCVADAVAVGVEPEQWPITAAELLAMPLSEFAEARRVVRVVSSVLGEVVIFASDNAVVDPGESLVVYRAVELRELIGLSEEDLKTVHEVKRVFQGTIEPS